MVAQTRRLASDTVCSPPCTSRDAHTPSAWFPDSGQRVTPGNPHSGQPIGRFHLTRKHPHSLRLTLLRTARQSPALSSVPLRRSVPCMGPGQVPAVAEGWTTVSNRCIRKIVAHLWFFKEQTLSYHLIRPSHSWVCAEGRWKWALD